MADEAERRCFLRSLRQSLLDLSRRIEHDASAEAIDYVIFRLRQISRHLLRLGGVDNITEELHQSLVIVTSLLSQVEQQSLPNLLTAEGSNGCVGRPRFEIPREQLEYFFDYDFSLRDIAEALGVSQSTVKRRAREYGISSSDRKTVMTDDELDDAVRQVKIEFPNGGYRRVHSQLLTRGIKVSQLRVQEAMHRTDPEGVAMRWLSITPRAVYHVSGPLALWHIDGNHKLIRYLSIFLIQIHSMG